MRQRRVLIGVFSLSSFYPSPLRKTIVCLVSIRSCVYHICRAQLEIKKQTHPDAPVIL